MKAGRSGQLMLAGTGERTYLLRALNKRYFVKVARIEFSLKSGKARSSKILGKRGLEEGPLRISTPQGGG